jgi:ATPase subunit of ABC transporter with duplicated ATPase domains
MTASNPVPPVLRVSDLAFAYPRRPLFAGWGCTLGPGLTWLRGANGSGKSTLLKLLAGSLPPVLGELQLADGTRLTARMQGDQTLPWRQRVFWCGPGAIAFDHLRPLEYFGFLAGLYPGFDAAALALHLQGFGLQGFMQARLAELSTGTQRKMWLCAALVAGTPLTLLDEPLNALDEASLAYLQQQLRAAAAAPGARAWLVASHEAPLPPAELQALGVPTLALHAPAA